MSTLSGVPDEHIFFFIGHILRHQCLINIFCDLMTKLFFLIYNHNIFWRSATEKCPTLRKVLILNIKKSLYLFHTNNSGVNNIAKPPTTVKMINEMNAALTFPSSSDEWLALYWWNEWKASTVTHTLNPTFSAKTINNLIFIQFQCVIVVSKQNSFFLFQILKQTCSVHLRVPVYKMFYWHRISIHLLYIYPLGFFLLIKHFLRNVYFVLCTCKKDSLDE